MDSPIIDPPLRGEWQVIHNPADAPYAFDFIAVEHGTRLPCPRRSLLTHLLYRVPASATFGWNRSVRAPFDGEVIEARDGYPDTIEMNLVRDFFRNVIFLPDLTDDIHHPHVTSLHLN